MLARLGQLLGQDVARSGEANLLCMGKEEPKRGPLLTLTVDLSTAFLVIPEQDLLVL